MEIAMMGRVLLVAAIFVLFSSRVEGVKQQAGAIVNNPPVDSSFQFNPNCDMTAIDIGLRGDSSGLKIYGDVSHRKSACPFASDLFFVKENVDRKPDCTQLCVANEQCDFYTFNEEERICTLKTWSGDCPEKEDHRNAHSSDRHPQCVWILSRVIKKFLSGNPHLPSDVDTLTGAIAKLSSTVDQLKFKSAGQQQLQTPSHQHKSASSGAAVYFHVQTIMRKFEHYNTQQWPISFGKTVKNIGNAMDATKGVFTAPITGFYLFIFDGRLPHSGAHLQLGIFINDDEVTGTWKDVHSTYASQPLIKPLEKGDRVYIKMQEGHKLWNQEDDANEATDRLVYFMGFLLE